MRELLFHSSIMNAQIKSTCYACCAALEEATQNLERNGFFDEYATELRRIKKALFECAKLTIESNKKIESYQKIVYKEFLERKKLAND